MKELSILREKAKAYDEAIAVINKCEKDKYGYIIGIKPSDIFPALKESEDESIRKSIINFLITISSLKDGKTVSNKDFDSKTILGWVTWLESKGSQILANSAQTCKDEQKSADKVEQKFKNGQWIVWQDKCYKVNYNGCGYELVGQNGLSTSLKYGTIDENAHLWTIQDAKAGDILADDYGIYIFDEFDKDYERCFLCIGTYQYSKKVYEYECLLCSVEVHPATKEQVIN